MIDQQLKAKGFTCGDPLMPKPTDDYYLQDDSDGLGPYIRRWVSAKPCPFPEFVREPATTSPTKGEVAKQNSEAEDIANSEKEREDLMKAADIVREAGEQVQRVTNAANEAVSAAEARTAKALEMASVAIAQRDAAFAELAALKQDKAADTVQSV